MLAAITASFLGANRVYRRPVAAAGGLALGAGVLTWLGVVWLIGRFHGSELSIQAATGIPALIVLLIMMNWFFHKVLDRPDRPPSPTAPGAAEPRQVPARPADVVSTRAHAPLTAS